MKPLSDEELVHLLFLHCLKFHYKDAAKKAFLLARDIMSPAVQWLSAILILPYSKDVAAFEAFLESYEDIQGDFGTPELTEAVAEFVDSARRLYVHLLLEQRADLSDVIAAVYRFFPKPSSMVQVSESGGIRHDRSPDAHSGTRRKILTICANPQRTNDFLESVWRPAEAAARAKLQEKARTVGKSLPGCIFDMVLLESDELWALLTQPQQTLCSTGIARVLRGKAWLYEEDVAAILQLCASAAAPS